ncbi:hypothetical protein R8Z50_17925 [Longispora sp. K20-0274]|uniref:hypothetical protein n=1 Tax=Longispora sp. K20-0274 TaxID=3088255 RepID=UPI003999B8F6
MHTTIARDMVSGARDPQRLRSGVLYRVVVHAVHLMCIGFLGLLASVGVMAVGATLEIAIRLIAVFGGLIVVCFGVAWLAMLGIAISGFGRVRAVDAPRTQVRFYAMLFSDLAHPFSWWRR